MPSDARISADKKFNDMQKRQQAALREEEVVLEAARAKTARLRAQRLQKEAEDEAAAEPKRPSKRKAAKSAR